MTIAFEPWASLAALALAMAEGRDNRIHEALSRCRKSGELGSDDVVEAILQTIPFAGFPAAIETLGLWDRESTVDPPESGPESDAVRTRRGDETFEKIYGSVAPRVKNELLRRHPKVREWILRFAYGEVMARGRLPLAAIEAVGVASLIGQANDDHCRRSPLRSHLRGAMRLGWDRSDLERLFDFLAGCCPECVSRIELARSILG